MEVAPGVFTPSKEAAVNYYQGVAQKRQEEALMAANLVATFNNKKLKKEKKALKKGLKKDFSTARAELKDVQDTVTSVHRTTATGHEDARITELSGGMEKFDKVIEATSDKVQDLQQQLRSKDADVDRLKQEVEDIKAD
jgi:chromosome segregation ATPase